jgi:two-component system, NarL family, sensor histidine kinase BarA
MFRGGISLANKCLLLFGAAVVLIILAALSVPMVRLIRVVDETQRQLSVDLVDLWQRGLGDPATGPMIRPNRNDQLGGATITLLFGPELVSEEGGSQADRFVAAARSAFTRDTGRNELHQASWDGLSREYRYARAVRDDQGALSGLVIMQRKSSTAWDQALTNLLYLGVAALVALGLALLVFYLITNKLILSPVRDLKDTAELVREGNLAVRADIRTGDEFEELAGTFNQMLDGIRTSQEQLRAINQSLDLKVRELDEQNVALFEANKLKGEFLASVSHELRTPLNSIIGFTELLIEAAEKESAEQAGSDAAGQASVEDPRALRRRRYLNNINTSGRSLLEMINGLLEMAKVEAGKLDLHVEKLNVRDACELLLALMRPLADRGGVELILEAATDVPNIETDAKKFQQVIFNLLSNAVKFTSERAADERAAGRTPVARVTLRAERLVGRASAGIGSEDRVRVSVLDTGPGIAAADHKRIFEKFQQLDTGHTRRHAGTGLGLAISRELTTVLQGELTLDSEPGRGSMFSVVLPMALSPERVAEMRTDMANRAAAGLGSGSDPSVVGARSYA